MDKLKYEKCENCQDWNGCISHCMDICMNPFHALEEFNSYRSIGTVEECRAYGKSKTRIIDKVIAERNRQDEKWGEQNHFPERWATIIGEEYGEMCKAINEFGFDHTPETEQEIFNEAIQTIASCMAMLECMERCRSNSVEM